VSGWPPLALALSFELLILVTRQSESTDASAGVESQLHAAFEPETDATQPLHVVDPGGWWGTAPDAGLEESAALEQSRRDTETERRATELIASGAGRVRLERELGVTEHVAKQLIRAHRGSGVQERKTS
jgi:hypothetical protein